MSNELIAFGIVSTAAVVVAVILVVAGSDPGTIVQVTLSVFGAYPVVLQQIEKVTARSRQKVPAFERYALSPWLMMLSGALVLFAFETVIGATISFVAAATDLNEGQTTLMIRGLEFFFLIPIA